MAPETNTCSTFIRLPTELLSLVVAHTIPEGFESLSLTCKHVFAVCEPRIKRHNELDRRYRSFSYGRLDPSFPFPITTAFHLLARIIAEPTVARYIRHADFTLDTHPFFKHGAFYDSDIEAMHSERVVSFVAKSSILRSTGLDAHAAAHVVGEDVSNHRYSQHAAALLLTMLPNVESLALPVKWRPNEMSIALLAAVVRSAVAHDGTPGIDCSLAKTKTLRSPTSATRHIIFALGWAIPFLCLPCIQSVHGDSFVGFASFESMLPHGMLLPSMATGLRRLHLTLCCLGVDSLRALLRGAPNLKTLRYQHTYKDSYAYKDGISRKWDLTDFLNTIAGLAGDHLEELSLLRGKGVDIQRPSGLAIASQFRCLRLLELPSDIFGHIHPLTDLPYDAPVVSYRDVIPASVTKLAFDGGLPRSDTGQGLETFFHGWAKAKHTRLPKLEELHLACPHTANGGYVSRRGALQAECQGLGVEFHSHCFHSHCFHCY